MKTNADPGTGFISMPAPQYHSMHEYLSNSMLGHFLESPAHLQEYLRNPPSQTPAQALGQLIHTCVLEPECLGREYTVAPKFNRRSNAGKAEEEAWIASNPGVIPIDDETFEQVQGIIRSVYSHDAASAFLQGGIAEQCVFWTDEKTGVKCRARIDYYRQDVATLNDVKSTRDAKFKAFQRSVYDYGYYRQLAFYARGLKANGLPVDRHVITAVETSAPFGVVVYDMDPTAIIRAEAEIDEALEQYAECMKSGAWPSYTQEIQPMFLPSWAS